MTIPLRRITIWAGSKDHCFVAVQKYVVVVLSDEFELTSDYCGMQEPMLNAADATQ